MSKNRFASTAVSRRATVAALAVAFVSLVGFYAGCASRPTGPVTVPLEFRPREEQPLSGLAGSLSVGDARVHVEQVKDRRTNPDLIGTNVEKQPAVPVYHSGKSPSEFLHDVLEDELRNLGVEIADAPDAADRIVAVELNKLFVEESGVYRGEARATVEVRDKASQVIWRGAVGGDGRNFGNSLKVENYQETLSDATRKMLAGLLSNPGFQKSLAR